ncbi:MAG: hypothetical protein IJ446_04245 [Oscillospiraceae bacterium]|nr:hypothetical protein [Oscillospiraceae bacterium]
MKISDRTVINKICCAALSMLILSGCAEKNDDNGTYETEAVTYKVIYENNGYVRPDDYYNSEIGTEYITVPPEMRISYGYEQLEKNERQVYDIILEAVINCEETVEIPNIDRSGKVYNKLLELLRCENSALFHIKRRETGQTGLAAQSFTLEITYSYTPEQVNRMIRETEKQADNILGLITDDMDDYDKLKLFHDSLIINCSSDIDGEYADTVYGALVDKKALCEGYARAFSYLCSRSGIENIIVTGTAGEAHMWNMVKLDGNWYHVDVTWDHPDRLLSEHYPDMVLYNYFLVSDADLTGSRTIDDRMFTPPRATSSIMNYFYHEGMYADSYEAALNVIETGCAEAISENRHSFMVKLASDQLYSDVIGRLSARADSSADTDISAAMQRAGFNGRISYTDMYSSGRVIVFLLDY